MTKEQTTPRLPNALPGWDYPNAGRGFALDLARFLPNGDTRNFTISRKRARLLTSALDFQMPRTGHMICLYNSQPKAESLPRLFVVLVNYGGKYRIRAVRHNVDCEADYCRL